MNRLLAAAALAAALGISAPALAQLPKDAAKSPPAAPQAGAGGNVATVNGVAIPRQRADMLVKERVQQGVQDSERLRAAVKEELINREILVQEAARSGLAKRPEIAAELEMMRQSWLVQMYLRDWAQKNPASDAEVQKEYDRAKAQTGQTEYRARHILVASEDEAKKLIGELQKGAKFEDLAQKSSIDEGTKPRGGDLDWAVPATFDKAFADALVKLEKGKMTDAPVRSRFGFHVIRLDDVRPVNFPALAQVRQQIQQRLMQNKVQDLIRDLRAKAKVE